MKSGAGKKSRYNFVFKQSWAHTAAVGLVAGKAGRAACFKDIGDITDALAPREGDSSALEDDLMTETFGGQTMYRLLLALFLCAVRAQSPFCGSCPNGGVPPMENWQLQASCNDASAVIDKVSAF